MGLGVLKRYLFSLRTVLVFARHSGRLSFQPIGVSLAASRAHVDAITNPELGVGAVGKSDRTSDARANLGNYARPS